MRRNPEKLAKELIRLRLEYSEQDFSDAIDLIENRWSLTTLMSAVAQLRAKVPSRVKPEDLKTERSSIHESEAGRGLPEPERLELLDFLEKVRRADILPENSSLRDFASESGLRPFRRRMTRETFVRDIGNHLAALDHERRRHLMKSAAHPSTDSSLKRWSNVIVKREGP